MGVLRCMMHWKLEKGGIAEDVELAGAMIRAWNSIKYGLNPLEICLFSIQCWLANEQFFPPYVSFYSSRFTVSHSTNFLFPLVPLYRLPYHPPPFSLVRRKERNCPLGENLKISPRHNAHELLRHLIISNKLCSPSTNPRRTLPPFATTTRGTSPTLASS